MVSKSNGRPKIECTGINHEDVFDASAVLLQRMPDVTIH